MKADTLTMSGWLESQRICAKHGLAIKDDSYLAATIWKGDRIIGRVEPRGLYMWMMGFDAAMETINGDAQQDRSGPSPADGAGAGF